MKRAFILTVILLWPGLAHALKTPDSTQIGDTQLVKVADVKRSLLFWDLYQVTVYAPEGQTDREALLATNKPIVVALTALYGGGFPGEMPQDWQDAILPVLNDKEEALLSERFGAAGKGDIIWIAYDPERGGWLSLNQDILIRQPDKDLVSAFLTLWLDDHPISKKLNRSLARAAE